MKRDPMQRRGGAERKREEKRSEVKRREGKK